MSTTDGSTIPSPAEALEIAQRFIDGHFHNQGEGPRIGIPADPLRDDDLRLTAFLQCAVATSQVRPAFIALMESEIAANDRKGKWADWKPGRTMAMGEIQHHITKLDFALLNGTPEAVSEFAADVANLCMKLEECYGVSAQPADGKEPA